MVTQPIIPAAAIAAFIVGVFGAGVSVFNAWRLRVVNRAIVVAGYREKWLLEVREQYSIVMASLGLTVQNLTPSDVATILQEAERASFRLGALLSLDDDEAAGIRETLLNFASTKDDDERQQLRGVLNKQVRGLLKSEWDRLKTDLKETTI